MKRALFLLTCLSINFWGSAQESAILENYIQVGLQNNIGLKKQEVTLEKALNSINIARSNYAPLISFNPTYTLAAGGRSLQFPIGDLLNPVYGTLNQLTNSKNFPSVENVDIQFAPNNFHETVFKIQYPLFNSNIKYNWLIQKELLNSELAKQKVLQHELRYEISTAYIQYLKSLEGIKTISESILFLGKLIDFNENLVKNKVALKDIVLSAKYEQSKIKQQLTQVESQSKIAKAYFNFLLNRPANSEIEVDRVYIETIPSTEEDQFYQNNALRNRPEFMQLQSGINVSETAIQLAEKNTKLPELYFGGSAGFQGFGYTFKDQAFAVGQVGLKWDLFHGKEKQYKIQQATIQKKILNQEVEEVKQQVAMQVTQAFLECRASEAFLNESSSGIEQTNEVLRILESKYKNGNALNIEILKAQNDVLTAKLNQVVAKHDYWLKTIELKKVSGM
jgi:outer membrane protein TolC